MFPCIQGCTGPGNSEETVVGNVESGTEGNDVGTTGKQKRSCFVTGSPVNVTYKGSKPYEKGVYVHIK